MGLTGFGSLPGKERLILELLVSEGSIYGRMLSAWNAFTRELAWEMKP